MTKKTNKNEYKLVIHYATPEAHDKKIGKNQMSKRNYKMNLLVIHYASEEESKSIEYLEEELIKRY
ncbi:hypothetical protein NYE25_12145 [Paenibacillus sp. FSL E2-8871]|uniref:Uncharacterized protein n=1 Tax=Paenibacillus odorifer TaxID=189426 RepID=A0A1R0ZHP4_9BACL|nr:hypothetical protein [Paenibacillus odorifer]OME70494.1 hypothetical protein BSK65_11225 [Paenibacillus odorifer]